MKNPRKGSTKFRILELERELSVLHDWSEEYAYTHLADSERERYLSLFNEWEEILKENRYRYIGNFKQPDWKHCHHIVHKVVSNPTGELRYLDIPIKAKDYYKSGVDLIMCPACKGHGLFNITINAYSPAIPGGKRQHFQGSCQNCNGWGWVPAEQGNHIHKWQEIGHDRARKEFGVQTWGMFCHVNWCPECNDIWVYDSSG